MPQADVTQARLAAERAWRYARDVSSELVASWPAVRHEEATRPSWMLQDLPEYHPSARTAAGPAPASELLVIPDPAPPLAGRHLPGGTRGLRAQSNCPLRAFLEMRLGARELDEPTRGLAPWRRGLLAHRALELLYTGIRSSADLGAAVDLRARVRGAIQRAAREQLGPRLRGVQRRVMELERARLAQRIDSLLTVERNRAAFSVSGVELRRSIAVAGITIEARLDRLDTDAEGRLIVIDYKTGAARPAAWLQARPADVQVPLYVLAVGAQTGAAVIVDLKSNPPRYRGLWDPQLNLPGRNSLGSWTLDELTRHWRHEITLLVEEMAAGDARLMPDRPATAQGAFAPVTRIYERLQQ